MNHLFKHPHCVRSSLISIFFESFADLSLRMVQKRLIIASLPYRYTEIHLGKKKEKKKKESPLSRKEASKLRWMSVGVLESWVIPPQSALGHFWWDSELVSVLPQRHISAAQKLFGQSKYMRAKRHLSHDSLKW